MKRLIFALLVSLTHTVSHAAQLPAGFVEQLIAQNLDPTDLVLAPDGRIFITIKSGKILIVENGALSPSIFLDIPVDNYNERGLGHMVLDPNFDVNHYYYVYYTVKDANHNRVSRFTANGNSTLPGSEVILLELNVLSGTIHNAGDMAFGLDGKLYVSVGDGSNSANAQSKTTLLGKVLRINSDGSIPTDNPFFADNTFTNQYKAIYALGFRNPYSLDIQATTGKIFVSDVGESTWEEVNNVQAGKNYGWPGIEGVRVAQTAPADYQDPVYAYHHGSGAFEGCAIVGAAFYNPSNAQFPAQYIGQYFFADYCNGYIHYIDPANGNVQAFASNINRPVAMIVGSDGAMYYLARAGLGGGSEQDNTSTNDGTLWKVTYTGSGLPFISVQPQSTLAAVGDNVNFIISASGTQPLSYQWMENDVTPIPGATSASYTYPNAQLADNGKKFSCVVTNGFGSVTTQNAILTMTSNTRPVPQFTTVLPGNATLYQAGQTLQFSGSAMDAEDGALPASGLKWKIDFHHHTHVHPGLEPTSGITSGSYVIPRVGETSDDVFYRVILTATDNQGLTSSVSQDIFPQKVTITLATTPTQLTLNLDGQPIVTPASITSVVGVTRTLEAPIINSQAGNLFSFSNWTQAGLSRLFTFDAPVSNVGYSAVYTAIPTGTGDGLVGLYFNTVNATATQQQPFNGSVKLVRVDSQIDFDWGNGSPAPGVIGIDFFTVRWIGEVLPQFSEAYTFYLTGDDGVRLWINDQQIIDKWIPQGATEWTGTINLVAGQKYPIRVEYFESAGQAVAKLKWSSAKLPKQTIPKSQLSTANITGITDQELRAPIVFPSPADAEITVRFPTTEPVVEKYQIIDLTGRIVLEGRFAGNQTDQQIDIRSLPSGFLILRIRNKAIPFLKQ